MTKSQLQSALTGHNVSVPASARKSVFVGLYADHVLFRNCNCRSATIRVRDKTNMTTSGFSSDDDIDDYIQPVAVQPKGKVNSQTSQSKLDQQPASGETRVHAAVPRGDIKGFITLSLINLH